MKSLKRFIVYLTAILLVIFAACTDWFELEPENDLIRQEFWQKKADVDAVVAAMYDALRETSLESLIWGELRADIMIFTGSDFDNYNRIANVDISPSNDVIKWNEYYSAINLANTLMYYADDVVAIDESFTAEEKLIYDSEALFIRSLCYFYLIRLWKDVPLILQSTNSDTIDFFQPKSSEAEITKQIIEDLKYAETIADKPDYNFPENPNLKGRVNVYAIQALLADIYLWAERYDDCIAYCDKIINTGLFSLEAEQTWFELYYPGNSIESIFEIQFNDRYPSEDNPIYDKMIPLGGGSLKVRMSSDAAGLFSTDDIRACDRKYSVWKYQGQSYDGLKRQESERDANYIYYRYADVLLMKAEALIEKGQFGDANNLINMVVQRAGLSPAIIEPDREIFRSYLLEERAREFAFEGKRWFDILRVAKRNDFANSKLIREMILLGASAKDRPVLQAKLLDTMSYYLPIHEDELKHNPNLEQNPFYDR